MNNFFWSEFFYSSQNCHSKLCLRPVCRQVVSESVLSLVQMFEIKRQFFFLFSYAKSPPQTKPAFHTSAVRYIASFWCFRNFDFAQQAKSPSLRNAYACLSADRAVLQSGLGFSFNFLPSVNCPNKGFRFLVDF